MKKLLLGILIGLALFPVLCDLFDVIEHHHPNNKTVEKVRSFRIFPAYGAGDALIGNCTKDVGKNGFGWIFISREYYRCGKISIFVSDLIYGEYEHPRNPELEKQACKNCSI